MRIGTILFLLVVVVMGFGFLLSSNLYMQDDLAIARDQLGEVTRQKNLLESQLAQILAENIDLKRRNAVLAQEKSYLEGQIQQIQATAQTLRSQNVALLDQIDKLKKVNALTGYVVDMDMKSMMLALFIPLLPVSLAGSILLYRSGKIHRRMTVGSNYKVDEVLSMQVTSEEMRLIRQMRRTQQKY